MRRSHSSVTAIAIALLALTFSFSVSAQTRAVWNSSRDVEAGKSGRLTGSVSDVDAARLRFTIVADSDTAASGVTVNADAVSTVYYGFGRASEVFRGSNGFGQLRTGDRVEVQGIGAAGRAMNASDVILIGRAVASEPVTATAPSGATPTLRASAIDGVVRQLGSRQDMLVVETSNREMITVIGSASTPVYYRNETYKMANIEVGDRVSIDAESRSGGNVRARSITVLQSVSETTTADTTRRTLTSVSGRVSRVDDRVQTFRVTTTDGEVRVDARYAYDEKGNRFRMSDLHSGDSVVVSGEYDSANSFRADTIRFTAGTYQPLPLPRTEDEDEDEGEDEEDEDEVRALRTVVIYGTIEADLRDSNQLRVLDTNTDRSVTITVVDDFVVRLKNGNYVTADQLREGDRVVVQAFRVGSDRYIAQTIRTR